jgi:hypothetical protein
MDLLRLNLSIMSNVIPASIHRTNSHIIGRITLRLSSFINRFRLNRLAGIYDSMTSAQNALNGVHKFGQIEWFLKQLIYLQPLVGWVEKEIQL